MIVTVNRKSDVVAALMFLDAAGVDYVWIHGYERELESDVDLAVSKAAYVKLSSVLRDFCERFQFRIVQVLRHEFTGYYFVLAKTENAACRYLVLDFCTDYMRDGRTLIRSEEFIKGRMLRGEFYIPNPAVEGEYLFLKRTLKGAWLSHHREAFQQKLLASEKELSSRITRHIGVKRSAEFMTCVHENDLATLNKSVQRFRKAILGRSLVFSSGDVFVSGMKELIRLMKRVRRPTGLFLAMMGPDGSGKSTVAAQTALILAPAFRKIELMHWRPGFLPEFSGANAANGVTNPHKFEERGRLLSTLKFFYYLLDFVLGYCFKIVPLRIKSTLVFFDRYYYDFLVDQKRYRMNVPRWIVKACAGIVARPDAVFFLHAKPEVILERKREMSREELTRQNDEIEKMAPLLKGNFHSIDANKTIDEIVMALVHASFDIMASKSTVA